MDYQDRHVVVTGGTGALGAAVLDALLQAGALCHVPYRSNLVSAYLCSRSAAMTLRRLGSGERIVNVAARQALEHRLGAGSVTYTIAKAAVAALTTSLGAELAKEDILVNAVAPSIMDTPGNRAAMPKADFQSWPTVEDVAAAILFLASPANTVTRGAVVPVYGRS